MNQVVQWIVNNPVISAWITIISLFGVVVTVTAFVFQIKDKRRKKLCYGINSNTLLDNKVSKIAGIEVLFQKEKVKSVVVSKVKIWNGGNEIIDGSDFYPGEEFKISVLRHEKILAANIINMSGTCQGQVNITKYNEAQVTFYCLEPKQSISLVVYHTNTEEEKTKITAQIKGGKLINKSIEIFTEKGDLVINNGKYKLYFDGGMWIVGRSILDAITSMTGLVIKRRND